VNIQQCFHKFEKSVASVSVINVPECQTTLTQAFSPRIKLRHGACWNTFMQDCGSMS